MKRTYIFTAIIAAMIFTACGKVDNAGKKETVETTRPVMTTVSESSGDSSAAETAVTTVITTKERSTAASSESSSTAVMTTTAKTTTAKSNTTTGVKSTTTAKTTAAKTTTAARKAAQNDGSNGGNNGDPGGNSGNSGGGSPAPVQTQAPQNNTTTTTTRPPETSTTTTTTAYRAPDPEPEPAEKVTIDNCGLDDLMKAYLRFASCGDFSDYDWELIRADVCNYAMEKYNGKKDFVDTSGYFTFSFPYPLNLTVDTSLVGFSHAHCNGSDAGTRYNRFYEDDIANANSTDELLDIALKVQKREFFVVDEGIDGWYGIVERFLEDPNEAPYCSDITFNVDYIADQGYVWFMTP